MTVSSSFRVLLLGDFSYGESYKNAGARIISEKGYAHSTEFLRPFVDACDVFVLNLETPLASEEEFPSPYKDEKPWVHWADPVGTGTALADLGVNAVSLANNHTVDLGHAGLEETFRNLDGLGIGYFGAGKSRAEAERPYRIPVPVSLGGGEIDIHAAFQFTRRGDELFGAYARADSSGAARVSPREAVDPLKHDRNPDTLHVAFPHWGPNYQWKTANQQATAELLTDSGYDVVVGHGAHTIQEISQVGGHWVVYSIGNGNFCSKGRWRKYERESGVLPFGFWTILEVTREDSAPRRVSLKLYPVNSDNSKSGYQPRPVDKKDFDRIVRELTRRADPAGSFPQQGVTFGEDQLGRFIQLEVADWLEGERPGAPEIQNSVPDVELPESWRVRVLGERVQGIGYRRWLKKVAEENGLSGWVRNREDGAVGALLHGDRESVDKVLTLMRRGPSLASVNQLQIERIAHVPRDGFRIRTLGSSSRDSRSREKSVSVPGTVVNGVDLATVRDVLGGEWIGRPSLDQHVHSATFRLNNFDPGALLFVMQRVDLSAKWRRSIRQFDLTPEEIIAKAASRGACAAVTTKRVTNPPIPVLVVPDAHEAMFQFARYTRQRTSGKIVGVTGTVGKSTTTSLLSSVLAQTLKVHKTDANWNTAVGVADTLNRISGDPDAVVIEAAISSFMRVPRHPAGEVMRPDIAIITAIGEAHRDVAPTLEDTARMKGRLLAKLSPNATAILTADTPTLDYLREAAVTGGAQNIITYGRASDADLVLVDWQVTESGGMRVSASIQGDSVTYEMQSAGEGMALNSLGVIAAAQEFGMPRDEILVGLGNYEAIEHVSTMREMAVPGGTVLVVDDATNATVLSMKAAFELLRRLALQRGGRAIAALGQINYLWERAEELHASLAGPLVDAGVELVLTTGEGMEQLRTELGPERCGPHAESPQELVEEIRKALRPGDVLLVKGSSVDTGFRDVPKLLLQ